MRGTRWRYHYPQRAFPYQQLLEENRRRGKLDPEYELLDTGIFDDDRYWVVDVTYAKADPTDVLMTISVTNAGPDTEVLHVLPTLWFRNTWSWDAEATPRRRWRPRRRRHGRPSIIPSSVHSNCLPGTDPHGATPELLFCDNETNARAALRQLRRRRTWPKDGINDHVVVGCRHRQPGATRHQVLRPGTG